MNLFGKILIMLNLLLSLVFMGFAISVYATHKNWRDAVMLDQEGVNKKLQEGSKEGVPPKLGLVYQLANQQAQYKAMEERYLSLQKEMRQEQAMRDALLVVQVNKKEELAKEVEGKTADIVALTADKNNTTAAIAAQMEVLKTNSAQIVVQAEMIDKLRGEIRDNYDEVLRKTEEVAQAQAKLDAATNQKKVLTESVAAMKRALEYLGFETPQQVRTVGTPVPKIDGVVRDTTPGGLVEISLGSDDGLAYGHTLEVYREGATPAETKYLGRIQILKTTADTAVGKVLPNYRKGNIEKDDRVATRFN